MTKATKTAIPEDWQPDEAGRAFADARGVPEDQVDAFRDYHLANGNRMASWPAAWRTWCRNAVTFGRATGRPIERRENVVSLFDVGSQVDAWGVLSFVGGLPDVYADSLAGEPVRALAGVAIVPVLREVCEAAGLPEDWRGDLTLVCDWIRAGINPEAISEAIRTSRRPDKPGAWRFYDARVRGENRKAS